MTLAWRQKMWSHLDSTYGKENAHRLRSRLAMYVVEKLVPIWDDLDIEIADDLTFIDLVDATNEFLDGSEFPDDLRDAFDYAMSVLQNVTNPFGVAIAGAALAAARCALFDEHRVSDESVHDADVDPDTLDSHFLGSVAVAGVPWEPTIAPDKRRAYWLDWLERLEMIVKESRDDKGGDPPDGFILEQ